MSKPSGLVPAEQVGFQIYLLRGKKVMLDHDLAKLYGVKPAALRQQVKRKISRFPGDFMFQLSIEAAETLVSQFVIPSRRSLPYAFTPEGVAMLSLILRSPRAIQVSIAIMRAGSGLQPPQNSAPDGRRAWLGAKRGLRCRPTSA